MPIPAILPAIIGAGASILGDAANAASTSANNRKSRQWNEKMYSRQRADALADWNMQNEYNSPSAQMQRFRDANLNPNLIYGQGTEGNAGLVRGNSVDAWRPDAPHFNAGNISSSLMSIYDVKLKEAQTNNLEAQNAVAIQDAILKAAQTASTNATTLNTGVTTESGKFALSQAQRLADTSAQMAEQQLRKVTTETDLSLQANERAAAANSTSIAKALEEILSLRASRTSTEVDRVRILEQIRNLQRDATLKDLDIQLKKNGVQPGDEIWWRVIGQMLGDKFDVKKVPGKLWDGAVGAGNWLKKNLFLQK